MMKHLISILAFILLLAGCASKNELAEALLESRDISITWRGDVQVTYDPETFQLGYNSMNHEYRVYDDRLAYWFIVRCSEKPTSEGQNIKSDISWTGANKTYERKDIQLTVKKADNSGLIWLWSQAESLGIIIKNQ